MNAASIRPEQFETWVEDALQAQGGSASIVEVSRHIWSQHETELKSAGDTFFTWQYDVRWAAFRLRNKDILKPVAESPRGVWELA